jgi:hypothetical protein
MRADEIKQRAAEIAGLPVRVVVTRTEVVIVEAILPAASPVVIGDARGCNISLPSRYAIRERVLIRPESKRLLIFLDDDLVIQATVEHASTELPLKGPVKDWREGYPNLRVAALIRPKVIVKMGTLSVTLDYDAKLVVPAPA